ncbi:MAG: DUF2116 family Zn-ribbon domain-containing protein [Candidatus Methanomethylophilaceae archaeon]|nr:DUF2116 family Zn-ribbon domain-containing protein [Candidatus Methanomethylophilaceae archaeon]
MAAIRLPDHSHCIYCGDPIPFGEEYCDDICRQNEVARVRKEKSDENRFFILAGLSVVVIVALGFIF